MELARNLVNGAETAHRYALEW